MKTHDAFSGGVKLEKKTIKTASLFSFLKNGLLNTGQSCVLAGFLSVLFLLSF
jgi:hypothetical protein